MSPIPEQLDMHPLSIKEQLAFNLFSQDADRYQTTLTYVVYKTIEVNKTITLNQLKWLLHNELLLDVTHVESVVASLTSKTLFNTISRWRDTRQGNRSDTMHLRYRPPAPEFSAWVSAAVVKYPELQSFVPSLYKRGKEQADTEVSSL